MIKITLNAGNVWVFDGVNMGGSGSTRPVLKNIDATATAPNLLPNKTDDDTGIGSAAADQLSLIAGGVEGIRITESTGNIAVDVFGDFGVSGHLIHSVESGITASTTQSQGQQPLTKDINEISVVANASDVVTMPSAVAGLRIIIINNGANLLQVYPALGDDLGAGVNTSTSLAVGGIIEYVSYDLTNWKIVD